MDNIQPSKSGGWILNPGSTFLLTILDVDRPKAMEIKRILDEGYSEQTLQKLIPILMKHNTPCREVDQYVSKFKPKFFDRIEYLKSTSDDWNHADEDQKEELLEEFENTAIEALDIHSAWGCDLSVLFSWPQALPQSYYRQIATLLSHTYTMAQYATDERKQLSDLEDSAPKIEILTARDDSTCPYCKALSRRKYSLKEYPNIPLHLGCRCTIVCNF